MLNARTCLGGMVVAPHHLAAEAGAAVLREGGNAVEAMVAAASTIAVVYPHMNGIGGDGFWLIARPGADPVAIRACGAAAGLATPGFYAEQGETAIPARGPRAALTVAGAIGGWAEALKVSAEIGGRLPLGRLLSDAVRHARDGAPITRSQAALTREKWDELSGVFGFAETFAAHGPPEVGAVLRQPALCATLARLGEAGLDDFYRGDVARANADGLEEVGSPLRLSDLEAYRAARVAPAQVSLRTGTVFNHPPPTQGPSTLLILALFERLGVTEADGFDYVHGLVEATKRAFLRRDREVGDPGLVGEAWRDGFADAALAAEIDAIDRARALPWPQPTEPGDTVWLGAADRDGVVVSYIQSVFWEFGSGLVIPETGVTWQNRGASFTLTSGPRELAPGRLPFHTLNPSLARLADGRTMAFGTMGGEGQPQTQAAIYTRHTLFGQDMQAAVTAPRWLLGRTWGAETMTLKLENRFDPALFDALKAAGHEVEVLPAFTDVMGHAGMVAIGPDGVIAGASDPRSDGSCAGV